MKKTILIIFGLMSFCIEVLPVGLPKYFYKKMYGFIGGEKVTASIIRIDTSISGCYYYDRYGKPIDFSYRSNIKEDKVFIEEDNFRDANYRWNITGYFNGEFSGDTVLSGTWMKPDSSKSFDFRLIEYYPPGTVQLELIHLEETYGVCDSPGCASVSVTYPLMKNYPDKNIQDTINEFILSNILFPKIDPDTTLKNGRFESAEHLIRDFIKKYKEDSELVEDLHQYGYNWQGDYDLVVNLNEGYILGLSSYEYNYLGGAHGTFMIIHHNFDMQNGKRIQLKDIFKEGYEKKLNETAEKSFRLQYEVPRRQNLESAGYWFENNKFRLNDNFALSRAGITFQYNQYEIAPYSFGAPEIFIPWVKIMDLLKDDSAIMRLIVK